jgi:actin-like ATPase involved in cell morphogenesis
MPYVAGVDLGTTYSAAAIAGSNGVTAVDLGTRATVMPSVVAVRADGDILAGAAAERRLVLEPSRAAREFKRRLGDPTPILLGGVPYGAETLSGHLLRSIVQAIAEREGGPPAIVALSHPANYGRYKLGLLEEASRVAAIPVVIFVPEPVAAAVHYSSSERVAQGELIGVYDLGGGTFDASIVRRSDEGFEVVGQPDGLDRFGGIDMDEAVLGHVRHVLGDALQTVDGTDPAVISALARLRDECRLAKEVLSGDTDVAIPVMLPGLHTEVRLTRAEFEDMIRPRIRDTIEVLERTAALAGVEMASLARVLLIGGSSRIPLVGEMVRQATGRPVGLDTHPKLSVALGSARVALASLGDGAATVTPIVPEPELVPEPAPKPEPGPEPEPEPVAKPEPETPKPDLHAGTVIGRITPVQIAVDTRAAAEPAEEAPERRGLRGRTWGIVAALIGVAAIIAGVLYFGGDRSASETTTPPPDGSAAAAETSVLVDTPNVPAVESIPLRISIASTSDWTDVHFGEAQWGRPTESSFVSAPGDHREIFSDRGALALTVQQSVATANAGDTVTWGLDVQLIPGGSDPSFTIEKGHIGVVTVEVYDNRSADQVLVTKAVAPPSACDGPTTYTISLSDLGIGG